MIMHGWMDGWMDGCMGASMHAWVYVRARNSLGSQSIRRLCNAGLVHYHVPPNLDYDVLGTCWRVWPMQTSLGSSLGSVYG